MNRTTSRFILACAAGLGLVASTAASAAPNGITYRVAVSTSFGTRFADCFAFDSAGNLTVAGLGTLNYTATRFKPTTNTFEAVSPLSLAETTGFAIMFNGIGLGTQTSGRIRATGADEAGDYYVITGSADASCSAAARNGAAYRPQ